MPEIALPQQHSRCIRSFVVREGRFTQAQKRAFEKHWTSYGTTPEALNNLQRVFVRDAPITLEIGFGNGLNLLQLAIQEPDNNFLGIEMHRPGIGHLLQHAAHNELANLKIVRMDAYHAIKHCLPIQSLERVVLLFPDPWPKKRHHKRRLFNHEFLAQLVPCMKSGAVLHLATDWLHYAEQMHRVISENASVKILAHGDTDNWPCIATAFEIRSRQTERKITKLSCQRI